MLPPSGVFLNVCHGHLLSRVRLSMSQPPGTLYEIRWNEICPWLILVRALRVSLSIRVLAFAFVGVVLTQWGWAALDSLFSKSAANLGPIAERTADLAHDFSDIELAGNKLVGQMLKQLRVRGRIARSDIVDRFNESGAGQVSPDPVRIALSKILVVLRGQPGGELVSARVRSSF